MFGRLRTELIMHRISRSVHHLFGRPRSIDDDQHEDMGRAAVEYRLIYHAWPKAGDRIEMRAGFSDTDATTRRLVHWLLDPQIERCWACAEAVMIAFDLATRKIIKIPQADVKRLREQSIADLAL